jgi:T4-like virus Myoviridae tail sheath stabiliser
MNVNPGNHQQKGLDGCAPNSPLESSRNRDAPPSDCPGPAGLGSGWLEEAAASKVGLGRQAQCDPTQTGQIVNDATDPNKNVVYRYSKAIRGCDEAMVDLFNNVVVLDEDGKAHKVPIIWGTQERAISWMLQDNTKKDGSLVVERIRLPMMAIYSSGMEFDQSRYTYHKAIDYVRDISGKPGMHSKEKLDRDTVFGNTRGLPINKAYTLMVWTMYMEDVDQILEQIVLKFSPVAYIRVRGIRWETVVTLDSIANNVDYEPGDQNQRVIKYEFNLTAQAYIPQPVTRTKSVLSTKVDFYNSVDEKEIKEVLARVEEGVEKLGKAIG